MIRPRRAVLGALVVTAGSCTSGVDVRWPTRPASGAPRPQPRPAELTRLGLERVVQPFWAADGSRVLFYDQPASGRGGTWAIQPATGATAYERPDWGYYFARGTLVAVPRPSFGDTLVLHLPSGRTWTLPTTNPTVFSPDGTLVAYTAGRIIVSGPDGRVATGPDGRLGVGIDPSVAGSIVVASAEGQGARRLSPPVDAVPLAWLPGADGARDGRLLLYGRRPDAALGLWALDLGDSRLIELGRATRLAGVLPSPDGTWLAHVAMWNADPGDDGLWVTRSDGTIRHRMAIVGSYRWTADNRLLVLPFRAVPGEGHSVWEVRPDAGGAARRLVDPGQVQLRVANGDWDCSPDGAQLVFVSADDKAVWRLQLAIAQPPVEVATPPDPRRSASAGNDNKPYRLPFEAPPGPSTWYVVQWYGVTTDAYRERTTTYAQGQGIHFGIDLATRFGTPAVAVAPGRVLAIDGDYGSPPHNVVLQLADGNLVVYGHLAERTRHVQLGQLVQAGQLVGNTGDSLPPHDGQQNPHLHLEIRKQGRAVATNPVPYFSADWDDLALGSSLGPQFERDLDNPRSGQFLDDQPDISFGGPIITNFARPWPP